MANLEIAKKIIKRNYSIADLGIFHTRNICGDIMFNVYDKNGLTIDICREWAYFEVFGLSDNDFKELVEYYNSLG